MMRSWVDMLFIGPKLTWRFATMTVASISVIARRSRLLAATSQTARERREYRAMIQEKFLGSGESAAASLRSFSSAAPVLSNAIFFQVTEFASAFLALMGGGNRRTWQARYLRFVVNTSALLISLPMHLYIFMLTIIFKTAAPLHKRVTANAKRLRRWKK